MARVRKLLQGGADPDRPWDRQLWPPLMHAIHKGQRGSLRELLNGGADPNWAGENGFTPLMMAADYGDTESVRMLLAKGANPRAVNRFGLSVLGEAVGGTADIDNFTMGNCQTDTVRARC